MAIEDHPVGHLHFTQNYVKRFKFGIVAIDFLYLKIDSSADFVKQLLTVVALNIAVTLKFSYFFLLHFFQSKSYQIIAPNHEKAHCLHSLNNGGNIRTNNFGTSCHIYLSRVQKNYWIVCHFLNALVFAIITLLNIQ